MLKQCKQMCKTTAIRCTRCRDSGMQGYMVTNAGKHGYNGMIRVYLPVGNNIKLHSTCFPWGKCIQGIHKYPANASKCANIPASTFSLSLGKRYPRLFAAGLSSSHFNVYMYIPRTILLLAQHFYSTRATRVDKVCFLLFDMLRGYLIITAVCGGGKGARQSV